MTVGGIGRLRQLLRLILLLELLLQAIARGCVRLTLSSCSTTGVPLPSSRSRRFAVLFLLIVDYNADVVRRQLILALRLLHIQACAGVLSDLVVCFRTDALPCNLLPF